MLLSYPIPALSFKFFLYVRAIWLHDTIQISSICSIDNASTCLPKRTLRISPSKSKTVLPILQGMPRNSSNKFARSCWNLGHSITRCLTLSSCAKSQSGQNLLALVSRLSRTSSTLSKLAWHTIFAITSQPDIMLGNLSEIYHHVRYLLPHPIPCSISRQSILLCHPGRVVYVTYSYPLCLVLLEQFILYTSIYFTVPCTSHILTYSVRYCWKNCKCVHMPIASSVFYHTVFIALTICI